MPAVMNLQESPPSRLTPKPSAAATRTTSWRRGCARIWCTSTSMSTVGVQVRPPSRERATPDERPHARAVERERREGFPGERLYGEDLVIVEPPEPLTRANVDRGRHARNDTRSRFEMRGVRDGARLESNGTKSTPDHRRRSRNVFTEADLERARSLAAESRGHRVRHRDGGRRRRRERRGRGRRHRLRSREG